MVGVALFLGPLLEVVLALLLPVLPLSLPLFSSSSFLAFLRGGGGGSGDFWGLGSESSVDVEAEEEVAPEEVPVVEVCAVEEEVSVVMDSVSVDSSSCFLGFLTFDIYFFVDVAAYAFGW